VSRRAHGVDWSRPGYIVTTITTRSLRPSCALCGVRVQVGDMVAWGPRRREVVHDSCRPPLRAE
jgi:hypothetical protein